MPERAHLLGARGGLLRRVGGWLSDRALIAQVEAGWGTLNPETAAFLPWNTLPGAIVWNFRAGPEGRLVLADAPAPSTRAYLLRVEQHGERWQVAGELPGISSPVQRSIVLGRGLLAWVEGRAGGPQRFVLWDVSQHRERCSHTEAEREGESWLGSASPSMWFTDDDSHVVFAGHRVLSLRSSDCHVSVSAERTSDNEHMAFSTSLGTFCTDIRRDSSYSLQCWNVRTGQRTERPVPADCGRRTESMEIDGSELLLAVDHTMCLWDLRTQQRKFRVDVRERATQRPEEDAQNERILSTSFEGDWLWASMEDRSFRFARSDGRRAPLVELPAGGHLSVRETVQFHRQGDGAPSYSPDGRYAAQLADGLVLVDRATLQELATLSVPSLSSPSVTFSPGARWILLGAAEQFVLVDVSHRSVLSTWPSSPDLLRVAAVKDDGEVRLQNEDRTVFVWPMGRSPRVEQRREGAYSIGNSLAISEGGTRILSVENGRLTSTGVRDSVASRTPMTGMLLMSRHGSYAVDLTEQACRRLALREDASTPCHAPPGRLMEGVGDVDAEGRLAAGRLENGAVVVWSLSDGRVLTRVPLSREVHGTVSLRADGGMLWLGTERSLQRISLEDSRIEHTLQWPMRVVKQVLSPAASYVLLQTDDGLLERRRLPEGSLINRAVFRGGDGLWEQHDGGLQTVGDVARALRLGTCVQHWRRVALLPGEPLGEGTRRAVCPRVE